MPISANVQSPHPVRINRGELLVLEPDELRREGFRHAAAWFDEAARHWTRLRGRKAARQTLLERLDYQRELTSQDLRTRHMILYNAAGTNLCASRVDRRSLAAPFVVEHKLYWAGCDTRQEADYLAAILNAPVINEAIKPFQSTGLMGERDIEKKVLDLPIPVFDTRNTAHQLIAELGSQARSIAETESSRIDLPKGLARRRAVVRSALGSLLEEINEQVAKLL